jgi:hypothetical protein
MKDIPGSKRHQSPWDSVKATRRDVGEGLTARIEVTPDPTEEEKWAAYMRLHMPGGIWRAALEPMRAWAAREQDGEDTTPFRGNAWLAKGLLQDWELMKEAQQIGCFDSFAIALWSFARRWQDRVDLEVVEPDWERGRKNFEATARGGRASTRRAPHSERWEAVHRKMGGNPSLSISAASEHAAQECPHLGKAASFRKSFYAQERKLGSN